MMNGHLNENLSAYLDGDLQDADLMAAESHLAACAECRAELDGLRRVVRRAASLDDRPPEKDLWSGIAGRLSTPSTSDVVPLESRRRRFAFTVPQLAAAAIALMALSSAAGIMMSRRPVQPGAPGPEGGIVLVGNHPDVVTASYDSAITGMQQMLASRRGMMDTSTVRIVEQSLTVIDLAIRQAREALSRDPANMYLNGQLQRTLDRKLDVLRRAVSLPAAS